MSQSRGIDTNNNIETYTITPDTTENDIAGIPITCSNIILRGLITQNIMNKISPGITCAEISAAAKETLSHLPPKIRSIRLSNPISQDTCKTIPATVKNAAIKGYQSHHLPASIEMLILSSNPTNDDIAAIQAIPTSIIKVMIPLSFTSYINYLPPHIQWIAYLNEPLINLKASTLLEPNSTNLVSKNENNKRTREETAVIPHTSKISCLDTSNTANNNTVNVNHISTQTNLPTELQLADYEKKLGCLNDTLMTCHHNTILTIKALAQKVSALDKFIESQFPAFNNNQSLLAPVNNNNHSPAVFIPAPASTTAHSSLITFTLNPESAKTLLNCIIRSNKLISINRDTPDDWATKEAPADTLSNRVMLDQGASTAIIKKLPPRINYALITEFTTVDMVQALPRSIFAVEIIPTQAIKNVAAIAAAIPGYVKFFIFQVDKTDQMYEIDFSRVKTEYFVFILSKPYGYNLIISNKDYFDNRAKYIQQKSAKPQPSNPSLIFSIPSANTKPTDKALPSANTAPPIVTIPTQRS
ncbi:MAG: hypothetical protein A3F13_08015 [Gammaproteobacteria bacterium RIFCSPHIGHO2_12_FULL_40_19]|nr:MAG: hypothetical protein A3F13_08015 [Gammaproteobacteria bacterium RIFCSPHIGHO2_12_FULL_40_19]